MVRKQMCKKQSCTSLLSFPHAWSIFLQCVALPFNVFFFDDIIIILSLSFTFGYLSSNSFIKRCNHCEFASRVFLVIHIHNVSSQTEVMNHVDSHSDKTWMLSNDKEFKIINHS